MSTEQLQPAAATAATAGSSTSTSTSTTSDFVHAAKDVLSSIVGSAMCVYTGQPFDTGALACLLARVGVGAWAQGWSIGRGPGR